VDQYGSVPGLIDLIQSDRFIFADEYVTPPSEGETKLEEKERMSFKIQGAYKNPILFRVSNIDSLLISKTHKFDRLLKLSCLVLNQLKMSI
jgi:hypothetical protein